MSSLLGLSAYSDDDEDEEEQKASMKEAPATAASSSAGPAALGGLIAYDDSDEEAESDRDSVDAASTAAQPQPPLAAASASSLPAAQPLDAVPPAVTSSVPSAAPPSSAASSASAAAESTAAAAASSSSLDADVRMDDSAPPAVDAATHAQFLSLFPPSADPLPAPLAARHAANLARLRSAREAGLPPLVSTLLSNPSFHNPVILSRIAAQLQIAPYGSNLPSGIWAEQNLPPGQAEEDDWETIAKQAEAATAARLANRTSIDFVPSSRPPATSGAAAAGVQSVVNADGSITRVRVFDPTTSNPPPPGQPPAAVANTALQQPPRPRASKWDKR